MWVIYVVDANQTCPPISVVKDVVNPISIMMPHMISRFCLTSRPRELNYLVFPISRLDIPVLLEHPGIGYAAVVVLILLEIAAVGKPLIDLALTKEEVHVAAENYAISTLGMFKNKQSKHEMLVRYVDIEQNCIINITQKRRSTGVPYNKHKSCDLKDDTGYCIITQFPKDFIELPSAAFSIVIAYHIGLRQDALLCPERPQRLHFLFDELPPFYKQNLNRYHSCLNYSIVGYYIISDIIVTYINQVSREIWADFLNFNKLLIKFSHGESSCSSGHKVGESATLVLCHHISPQMDNTYDMLSMVVDLYKYKYSI
ncbi:hypothetical protein YC2023_109443 [Brassica napus]